jgi:6-phosphogluconolactonase
MGEVQLTVVPDSAALAEHAADRFIELAAAAIAEHGRADVALAGGSTPRAMNALLAASPRRERVAWQHVRFFFGDERCVPPDHPDSNYRMTRETLFAPLGILDEQIFRMRGEDEPHAAAAAYDELLGRELGPLPAFDAVFLGMGPDGHTASLFPGTIGGIDDTRRAVANWVAKFDTFRITLTPHVINAARHVTITAGGAEKAASLAAVIDGERDPDRYPSQLIAPINGDLAWVVDTEAASLLMNSRTR